MRKALVVGIDYYHTSGKLFGCVKDAHAVQAVLERHSDGSVNFGVKLLTATAETDAVRRPHLKDAVQDLFEDDSEIALFYFAGHGHVEATGGYLCGSDAVRGDDGLSLAEVLALAHSSRARNKIVVLDSCHAGIAGSAPAASDTAALKEGMTILTASTAEQYASEKDGQGVFTGLLVDALNGAAGNLVGDVTPGSVYAHIDQSLGPWQQRPVFKTNVKTFVSLRKVQPPIALGELQEITKLFPQPGFAFELDPSFEPERGPESPAGIPPPDPENNRKFALLQKYNRVNLVIPVGAPHMWHAAMNGKSCKLTALGEHYRRLVERRLL
jgi:hypothetical protein